MLMYFGNLVNSFLKPEPKLEEQAEKPAHDSICPICADSYADLTLKCGHIFHEQCVRMQLDSKWTGARITFNFLDCAICRQEIFHEKLELELKQFSALKKKIEELAVAKAIEDEITNGLQGDDLVAYSMKTLAFYACKQCKEPYCGGLVSCAQDLDIDTDSLRCHKCIFEDKPPVKYLDEEHKVLDLRCVIHGYKSAIFKCDSCCSVATWDCSHYHYCENCHNLAGNVKNYPCPGNEKCPLGIAHPPNGTHVHGSLPLPVPFVIGCIRCSGFNEDNDYHGHGSPHIF